MCTPVAKHTFTMGKALGSVSRSQGSESFSTEGPAFQEHHAVLSSLWVPHMRVQLTSPPDDSWEGDLWRPHMGRK